MKNKISLHLLIPSSLHLLIPFLLIPSFLFAQVPQGIPYQAMIRNSDGSALMNTNVTVRFTLHQNTTTGAVEYQETQALVTNAFGLINAVFGQGTAVQGTFSAINWSNATKFIQVEANDGNGFVDMGTQQMMSVPYAMQSGNGFSSVSATGDTLYLANGKFVILPGVSAANSNNNPNSGNGIYTIGNGVIDADGNFYETIIINGQEWMKENLKVTKYSNGDDIATGLDNASWSNTTIGAYTYYNSNAANNSIYGKLYNWYAVNDTRGLCPTGWHVPSDNEWISLEMYLGGIEVAGGKMKSITGWSAPNTFATNESGFDGLPGGYCNSEGNFYYGGFFGYYWSSTPNVSDAWFHSLTFDSAVIYRSSSAGWHDGDSVRCVKD